MVTKHNREHWPFEPQVMTDDTQEAAYLRLLEQEDEPEHKAPSPLAWCLYGLCLLLAVMAGWHFVAWWLQGAPL